MTNNGDDHLNRETSVSAELTETGVEAKTNSRAIAALDRLVGNIAEVWNSKLERSIEKRRAIAAAEKTLIEAAASSVAERIEADPELAIRALDSHLEGLIRKQSNKEAVAIETIEQLNLAPPTSKETSEGPDTISEEFIASFEPFAERASTDALRAKWAKVLASEIKAPGTFTNKALRVTDELNGQVAQLFETVCNDRLGNTVPKAIARELKFHERQALVNAELLVESPLGHVRFFREMQDAGGRELYICTFGQTAIGFAKDVPENVRNAADIQSHEENPTLPVFILTDAGNALASILTNHEREATDRLAKTLAEKMRGIEIRQYATNSTGEFDVTNIHLVPPETG